MFAVDVNCGQFQNCCFLRVGVGSNLMETGMFDCDPHKILRQANAVHQVGLRAEFVLNLSESSDLGHLEMRLDAPSTVDDCVV
jgi:hypothetical protein